MQNPDITSLLFALPVPVSSGKTELKTIRTDLLLWSKEQKGELVRAIQSLESSRLNLSAAIRPSGMTTTIEAAVKCTTDYIHELQHFVHIYGHCDLNSERAVKFYWILPIQSNRREVPSVCTAFTYELCMLYHLLAVLYYQKARSIFNMNTDSTENILASKKQFVHALWCLEKCTRIINADWTAKPPLDYLPLTVKFEEFYDIMKLSCMDSIQNLWAKKQKLNKKQGTSQPATHKKILSRVWIAKADIYMKNYLMVDDTTYSFSKHAVNRDQLKAYFGSKYAEALTKSYKYMQAAATLSSKDGDTTFMVPSVRSAIASIPECVAVPHELQKMLDCLLSNARTVYGKTETAIQNIQPKSDFIPEAIIVNLELTCPPGFTD